MRPWRLSSSAIGRALVSAQGFELVDEARYHRQALAPEFRIGGVEAEGRQQLLVPSRAAGLEHVEIFLGKAGLRALIDRVERVHEAIAEGIGIDIEGRMDEMRNIGPVAAILILEADCRAEALALDRHPNLADAIGGDLALPALVMEAALELDEGDLAHDRV